MGRQHRWIRAGLGCVIAAWLVAVPGELRAQSPPPENPPPPPPQPQMREMEAARQAREAEKDALKEQIRQYSAMVQAMRETLAARETGEARADEIERTVMQLSEAIGEITMQLEDLQLDVIDNRVTLRDGRGGEVAVEIPEDLPEQLSAGLSSITRMFLEEMPDTVRIGEIETGIAFDRESGGLRFFPSPQRKPRRVIEGGLVKIRDDMEVAANEDVDGDAVAVMGDAVIRGRVAGDVVVVLGDVLLTETAVVDGQVYAILGHLDREEGAEIGGVTVISPGDAGFSGELFGGADGWITFVGYQFLFVILLACVLLMLALTPPIRREALIETVRMRFWPASGLGLLVLGVGHLLVIGLAAILVLTVIGIPVAALVLIALMLADLAAIGVGSLAFGRVLCSRAGLACPRPWRELVLGMMIIHTPSFLASLAAAVAVPSVLVLPLTWLGIALKIGVICAGLGAILLRRFGVPTAPLAADGGLETAVTSPNA